MKDNQSEITELSIVVPFMNEQECLELLLKEVSSQLNSQAIDYELILVDDGSRDKSWEIITTRYQQSKFPLKAIRFSRNFGKEAAIRAGLRAATGKAVVVMDADLQHPPELLPQMYTFWKEEQFNIVEAVRDNLTQRSPLNEIGAKLFYFFLSRLAGVPLENATDYKLLDREIVDQINALPEKVSLFRGIVCWMGLPSKKLSFTIPERPAGSSRWSFFRLTSLAIDGITGFSTLPLRLATLLSGLFILTSFILIIQTLYNYLSGRAIEGFTTVIISVLVVGGVITGVLGIIGEYLARVYEEVKARPSYIIQQSFHSSSEED